MLIETIMYTNLNNSVVIPSSENNTAGGEYLSFTPHNSAPLKSSFSSSPPNLKWPPSHLQVFITLAIKALSSKVR